MTARIWVIGDTHFNHGNIIEFTQRPYVGPMDMNQQLIQNWNMFIGQNDVVWHLGDFGFYSQANNSMEIPDIWDMLNGEKHLLTGNHDSKNGAVGKLPWASVQDYKILKHNKQKYVLCHYPFASWMDVAHGAIHIHGHTHGNLAILWNRIDVGVDNPYMNYGPRLLEDIPDMMEKQNLEYIRNNPQYVDHHFKF